MIRRIAFWTLWTPVLAVGALCTAAAVLCLGALVLAVPVGFLILVF